jgi:hypothetical protein
MKVNRRFGGAGISLLLAGFIRYSSTLQIETCSAETSAIVHRSKLCHDPETAYNSNRCENLNPTDPFSSFGNQTYGQTEPLYVRARRRY